MNVWDLGKCLSLVTDMELKQADLRGTCDTVGLGAIYIPRNTDKYFFIKLGDNSTLYVHFHISCEIISHIICHTYNILLTLHNDLAKKGSI